MKIETILDAIRANDYTEEIWVAINVDKVCSAIYHKMGIDLLETGAIPPSLIQELMNISVNEVADEIVKRQGSRN